MKRRNSSEKNHRSLFLWGKRSILFFGLLLFFHCSFKTPTVPTWNTKLTIPLMKKDYDMVALIEKIDEPSLGADSLGNLFFHIQEDLDTIRLWGSLACDSVTQIFKDTLGSIKIIPSESKRVTLSVTDFYSDQPGEVEPSIATVEVDLDTFASFHQVTVKEGYITLKISNHLGLDLDGLRFETIDKISMDILDTTLIPGGIKDGDSVVQSLTFSDETFSNQLAIRINAHTPGGYLFSLEDKYFSFDFTMDSLIVTRGMAKIPYFELTAEEEITLPSDHMIDSAKIRTGSLFFHLSNFTDILAETEIDFPEFEKNGENLKTNCIIPAWGYSDLELSLDGFSFKPLSGNSIKARMKTKTDGSGDQLVSFSSSDSVKVDAFLSEIAFSQISGRLEPTVVDMGEIKRELDLPSGLENAHIKNASLSLDIHNGVSFPADLSVTVAGDKGQRLQLSGSIEPGSPWATSVTTIQEDDLDPLLDPVPQNLTVTGQITCGDGISSGTVNEEDFFFGELEIVSPLEFVLDSCQVEIEADSHNLNDDVKSLIEDQINSGQATVKIESHLPLDAEIVIFVSRSEENIFSNPDVVIGPIDVPNGELDHNGLVIGSRTSENTISLNHEQLQVFRNSPFYIAGRLDFPGSDGNMVKALATDFIKITSYVEVEVKNKKD